MGVLIHDSGPVPRLLPVKICGRCVWPLVPLFWNRSSCAALATFAHEVPCVTT